jgi:1,4-dihydroxy-2-naphthoate octaprenyltransferase
MKRILSWIQASRLFSQSYIFIPLLLGQAIQHHNSNKIDFTLLIFVQLYGIFNQLYIVYANDYADRETDKKNETFTIFSGGSRVIADGKIKPGSLLFAAWLMAISCLLLAGITAYFAGRPGLIILSSVGLFLLYAYSFPPFRISYVGGGEFLQMFGVGLILPLYAYVAQNGVLHLFPMECLLVLLPINLACAIATSLPDTPSDRDSGKHTIAVISGDQKAKLLIIVLELFSVIMFIKYCDDNFSDLSLVQVGLVPIIAVLFSLIGWKAKPGQFLLSVFVFFSILLNLSIQTILIAAYFYL